MGWVGGDGVGWMGGGRVGGWEGVGWVGGGGVDGTRGGGVGRVRVRGLNLCRQQYCMCVQ